jgi:hypothetical protein
MNQQQQMQALQQQVQALQQTNQHQEEVIGQQQQEIQELQQQKVESDEDDESYDDDDEEEEKDDVPPVMSYAMRRACDTGSLETIVRLLDACQSANCVAEEGRWTPVMWALRSGHLHAAIMLVGRGADLSRVSSIGQNVLHITVMSGDIDCMNWVLANTTIDINSTDNSGHAPIQRALSHGHFDAAKLLVEKGANLFMKNDDGQSPIDHSLGPQLLQHAKDLIWVSLKPLLLLSASCSANGVAFDPSLVVPSSLSAVVGNSDIVRE